MRSTYELIGRLALLYFFITILTSVVSWVLNYPEEVKRLASARRHKKEFNDMAEIHSRGLLKRTFPIEDMPNPEKHLVALARPIFEDACDVFFVSVAELPRYRDSKYRFMGNGYVLKSGDTLSAQHVTDEHYSYLRYKKWKKYRNDMVCSNLIIDTIPPQMPDNRYSRGMLSIYTIDDCFYGFTNLGGMELFGECIVTPHPFKKGVVMAYAKISHDLYPLPSIRGVSGSHGTLTLQDGTKFNTVSEYVLSNSDTTEDYYFLCCEVLGEIE